MPFQFSLVRALEFIRCGPHGTIDLAESKRILTSLAETIVSRGMNRALLDLRKVSAEPPLTYPQLYELAQAFLQAGFGLGPNHRLAVLVPLSRYEKAQFFAICTSGRSWNCHPCHSYEEAMEWMLETTDLPSA